MKNILALIVSMFSAFVVYSQRIETVCGEYTFVKPSNISEDEGIRIALERAKQEALKNKFGETVTRSAATMVVNEQVSADEARSSISTSVIGWSELKGEWLETISEPEYKINFDNNLHQFVINVNVCGKVREITTAKTDIEVFPLKNCFSKSCYAESFENGDDLFLWFKSPKSGYVCSYLVDDMENCFCLLPYQRNVSGEQKVKAGEKYIFFSQENSNEQQKKEEIDEYVLETQRTFEQNALYVIYSPNSFSKANDSQIEDRLPRMLSMKDFQKWLLSIQKDKDVVVKRYNITIQK